MSHQNRDTIEAGCVLGVWGAKNRMEDVKSRLKHRFTRGLGLHIMAEVAKIERNLETQERLLL